jgi:hypothetical protein
MVEFCHNLKAVGFRNDLNYETVKACGAILDNISNHHPDKVRNVLFKFLEKFTNNLFNRLSDELESYRTSVLGQLSNRSGESSEDQVPVVFEDDNYKLPDVKEPYLPPLKPNVASHTFTLVLDLDETLIHFIDHDIKSARRKAENLGTLSKRSITSINS